MKRINFLRDKIYNLLNQFINKEKKSLNQIRMKEEEKKKTDTEILKNSQPILRLLPYQ